MPQVDLSSHGSTKRNLFRPTGLFPPTTTHPGFAPLRLRAGSGLYSCAAGGDGRWSFFEISAPPKICDNLLHHWRFAVGGLFFVGVDLSVVLGVEGAVLRVELFGRHGESEAIFLALEADGVIAAIGIDHTLGERAGVDQFRERRGEVAILLVELSLGTHDSTHVAHGGGF